MNRLNCEMRYDSEQNVTTMYVEPNDDYWSMQLSSYFNQIHIVFDIENDHWEKIVAADRIADELENIHSSFPSWVSMGLEEFEDLLLRVIMDDASNIISELIRKNKS